MKLLTKTTLYYLLLSLPLLLVSGWFLYYNIQKSLRDEIDEELQNTKALWLQHIDTVPASKDITEFSDPFIQIKRSDIYFNESTFSDTLLYEPLEKERVPFRNLTIYIKRSSQYYKVSFQRSVLEQEDVFSDLALLMIMVFGGLLLSFLLINLYINTKVWKPFNASLDKITSLNMEQLQQVHFDRSSIKEFDALNTSLNAMTQKIKADYLSMKTFTQNASHEIQTPLAIIQSKLELLFQDSNLTEEQAAILSSASEATQRLSKLNQALLLITKIENNQFAKTEIVSLKEITEKYRSFFVELMEEKKVSYSLTVIHDWQLSIHPLLADMLISNLFSNAIKYNKAGGEINITITENSFAINNSSDLSEIDADILFKRFFKHDTAVGNGLGLAIVKEICDANGLVISYSWSNYSHEFILMKG